MGDEKFKIIFWKLQIDAIKPGVINYELLQEGGNYEVGMICF